MDEWIYWQGYLQAEFDYFGGISFESAQHLIDANPNPYLED